LAYEIYLASHPETAVSLRTGRWTGFANSLHSFRQRARYALRVKLNGHRATQ